MFLSPYASHSIRALWRQRISSRLYSSTNLSQVLTSAREGPNLPGIARRISSSRCNRWISRRRFPNTFLSQVLRSSDSDPSLFLMSTTETPYTCPQHVLTFSAKSGCVSQHTSYLKVFCRRLHACSSLNLNTTGVWSDVTAFSWLSYASGKASIHSAKATHLSRRTRVNEPPATFFSNVHGFPL